MKSYCHRLYQCTFHGIHVIRKLEAHFCRMSIILQEYAVSLMRHCHKIHILAQIVKTFFTHFTFAASNTRFQSYSVTNFKISNVFTNFHNSSAGLVPKYKRLINNPVSNSA